MINGKNASNIPKIGSSIAPAMKANTPNASAAIAEISCSIAKIRTPVGLPDICLSSEPQRGCGS